VASECTGPTATTISSTGFILTGRAVNSGNCVTVPTLLFGDQTVSYDGRGWVMGTAHWTEKQTVTSDGDKEIAAGDLFWSSDSPPIKLPSNSKGFAITVERIDGTKTYTEAGTYDRYRITYDRDSHILVIAPRPVNEALGG
jgi:hypothetical protein